jgi:leucyl-tRNA synthetase
MRYNHQQVEKKWQKVWEKEKVWQANDKSKKKKYYSLIEFPYPSGLGLHVGHIRSNTAMDIISRKRRMEGYNVLYPIGWDAFGLPTENYAIKTGISPQKATKENTDNFRKQLKSLGFSFDWDREINTTDPKYYRWTQWLFLQFFKHGLAYKDSVAVNWCPSCLTGLANEEVVGGNCDRCGSEVERKLKSQWMLRITAYADKLLDGLASVDFLDEIKTQQKNWIGRSDGRLIKFPITGSKLEIDIFTTRPDTIDGATYMVLAPEHPFISELKIKNEKEVERYIKKVQKKSDRERQENKIKTGIELKGVKVVNPYNNKKIPVWVSDYVLIGYGTGAIMAVPFHDERDREFAEKFKLPIEDRPLVTKKREWPGKSQINYKLKDWVFSRQRYWGEPIPIVNCKSCGFVPVPEKDLPIKLPKVDSYRPRPDGQSPLASVASWVDVKCPNCKGKARRETDTMPNWAGSSWYFLRYTDSQNNKEFADKKKLKYFMPVDWYNGGMEHVTLHLLYSRFWNIFLHDVGLVPCSEPYKKRTAHGMILGEGGEKMAKSKGNVINPDGVVKKFGADSLRLYEMFMGPFDEAIPWDDQGVIGTSRFINRVYNIGMKAAQHKSKASIDKELEKLLHQTIKKVSQDIELMRFNTAISTMMIFINEVEKHSSRTVIGQKFFSDFLKLLFPFAPHLSQELWKAVGNDDLLDFKAWPKWKEGLTVEERFELIIQIDGKLRGTVVVKKGLSKKEAIKLANDHKVVKGYLEGQKIKKVIFVPDRLINFIIG